MPLPAGTVIAGYRIERVLGVGGMGSVYLAQHPSLPRRDALKLLSAELSHDPQFRARFLREADLAATLDHPNIVTVYDRGQTPEGQLWMAMQFVDGTDAGAQLSDGEITVSRALHIVTEVAKALDYAHSRKLLHRDIKPANFLLAGPIGNQERVLLADFGIARALDDSTHLTATGMMVATASYAAPESIEGQRVDHRADVYSLGCALFRMLTGRTPYADFSGMSATLMAHVFQPIPRATRTAPWLPPVVDDFFFHALAKDPDRRFQSAGALAAAAAGLLGAEQQPAAPQRSNPTRSWQTPSPSAQRYPPPNWSAAAPPPSSQPGPPPGWAGRPPSRHARWRWPAIGAAAAIAVVVTAALGVRFATTSVEDHKDAAPIPAPTTTTATAPPTAVASATDTGPVGIITDDPTCNAWRAISVAWAGNGPLDKWTPDSPDNPIHLPASAWNPEQRAAMDQSGRTFRDMATKTVPLAQATPHRVMREYYEQFIAYSRAYADSLTNYFPQLDISLGKAAEDVINVLISTCNAARDGAAPARSVLVKPEAAPSQIPAPQDPANPRRFISATDKTTCGEWITLNQKLEDDPSIADWNKFDRKVPLPQWSPERKTLSGTITPLLETNADDIVRTAGRSSNPVIQDFAAFAAVYQRAYTKALPTYTDHDGQLGTVGRAARFTITDACSAVGV